MVYRLERLWNEEPKEIATDKKSYMNIHLLFDHLENNGYTASITQPEVLECSHPNKQFPSPSYCPTENLRVYSYVLV